MIEVCPTHGSYMASLGACPRCGKPTETAKTGANSSLAIVSGGNSAKTKNEGLIRFTVYGQPIPKKRPRLGKAGTYTPKATVDYEKMVKRHARQQMTMPFNADVFVHMAFYRKTRHRVDVDNLSKSVLDAMNKVAYTDDYLVKKVFAELGYDKDNPRVVITITHSENWMQALEVIPIESEAA